SNSTRRVSENWALGDDMALDGGARWAAAPAGHRGTTILQSAICGEFASRAAFPRAFAVRLAHQVLERRAHPPALVRGALATRAAAGREHPLDLLERSIRSQLPDARPHPLDGGARDAAQGRERAAVEDRRVHAVASRAERGHRDRVAGRCIAGESLLGGLHREALRE